MLFTMEQIQELHQFQIDLRSKYRGIMAEFNATYQWGQRGTKILNVGKQYRKRRKKVSRREGIKLDIDSLIDGYKASKDKENALKRVMRM